MVDRMETVEDDESIEMARRLAKEEGILSGISCGAPSSRRAHCQRTGHGRQNDCRDPAGFGRTVFDDGLI